jgi:WhiB family redox-sensing transcriptional regulator
MNEPLRKGWWNHAACLGMDVDVFFPHSSVGQSYMDVVQPVLDVCKGCPVVAECLEDAIRVADQFGIRGGLTADDRRKLRNRTRRKAAAS